MAEGDTLDAVNAEVCYNVICDLQEKKKVIGALYHQAHTANKRFQEMERDRLFESAVKNLHGYNKIEMTDEEINDVFGGESP